MKEHSKITVGFVVQKFVTIGEKHICVSQNFVAGDQIDYKDENGEPITIDTTKEQYQPFDMKQAPAISTSGLKFTCPDCGCNRLECCEEGYYSSEVLDIDEEGIFDYGNIDASGDVDRFQCLECGYVLKDCADEPITDDEDVAYWVKKNCEQPSEYIDPRYVDDNVEK